MSPEEFDRKMDRLVRYQFNALRCFCIFITLLFMALSVVSYHEGWTSCSLVWLGASACFGTAAKFIWNWNM